MQLAKFTAQLRRPRPLRSGVIAEMFVRNGEDADAAMQLGRSDLMDARVRVDFGDDMGSFEGDMRRPLPRLEGFVVCVYGENGPDADLITSLGLSKFLDMSVEVVITQLKTPEGATVVKPEPKRAASKPAPEKPPKSTREPALILWTAALWGNPKVWSRIGTDESYQAHLDANPALQLKGVFQSRRDWAWASMKAHAARASFSGVTAAELIRVMDHFCLAAEVPSELKMLAEAD